MKMGKEKNGSPATKAGDDAERRDTAAGATELPDQKKSPEQTPDIKEDGTDTKDDIQDDREERSTKRKKDNARTNILLRHRKRRDRNRHRI